MLFINIHIFDYLDPPESFVVKVRCKIACKFSVKIKLQVFNALLEIIMFKLLSSCLIKCFLTLISQGISHYVFYHIPFFKKEKLSLDFGV